MILKLGCFKPYEFKAIGSVDHNIPSHYNSERIELVLIYNTLKHMNELTNISSDILKIISIYANGKIKICDSCNKNEILYLKTEQQKGEFMETKSVNFNDVYCKKCIKYLINCDKCHKRFAKRRVTRIKHSLSIIICKDCIKKHQYKSRNQCNKCKLHYKPYGLRQLRCICTRNKNLHHQLPSRSF